jgi:hypothetical protein
MKTKTEPKIKNKEMFLQELERGFNLKELIHLNPNSLIKKRRHKFQNLLRNMYLYHNLNKKPNLTKIKTSLRKHQSLIEQDNKYALIYLRTSKANWFILVEIKDTTYINKKHIMINKINLLIQERTNQ